MKKLLPLRAVGGAVVLLNVIFAVAPAKAQSYSQSQALAYFQRQDRAGLASYANAWTSADPNNAEAWGDLGVALSTTGLDQPAQSVDALKRSLQLDPSQSGAWEALGVNELAIGQSSAAVDAMLHAKSLEPNNPHFYNNLAAAYREEGDIASALKTLDSEALLAQQLHDASVWFVLGNAYSRLHDAPNALHAYQQTLALAPDFAPARQNAAALEQYLAPPPAPSQGGSGTGAMYPGRQYELNKLGAPGNTCAESAASGCN